jgi:transcriptional regulator with XRE-family HTH domain
MQLPIRTLNLSFRKSSFFIDTLEDEIKCKVILSRDNFTGELFCCNKVLFSNFYLFYFRTLYSFGSMKARLSQKEIGQRITELRKLKGLSQENLAKRMKLSRPSLAQIELGNRSVDVRELQKFAEVLEFSLDDFVSLNFPASEVHEEISEYKTVRNELRVSVPSLKVEKFKNILLYILERCAGKPNVGETLLYKLLYFADFNYYELYEEHLTGAKYRKLPYGPVPQKLDSIITQMTENGQVQRIKTDYHEFPQTRYIPLVKPDLTKLKASEKEVIDKVIDQFSDWSVSSISAYSHRDLPWLASKEGENIDYELAFYREAPFSVRNYGNEIEEP